ncbi:MAG: hypothetical protein IPK95_00655 [Cellvibrionales bacterium]|jgi:hypothetical protein|nr:hypothetical protein [Cellvibrionales bacterium]
MELDAVPQDNSHTYGGHRKLVYATDACGEYVGVQSTGWEAETIATDSALDLLQQQQAEIWQRAQRGETSALEYYMVYRRMDVALLSQTSGIFQWRIRRHFKPSVYSRLPDRLLQRYSEALGLDVATLRLLVERP